MTIKDLAKYLSVSVSTVSRALCDDKNINKETKDKVLKAAKELGYKRNPIALGLKTGHSNTIGVIVPEMITPFVSLVLNGIQDVLNEHNIRILVTDSNHDPEKERENIHMLERCFVDGIIICLCNYNKNREEFLRLQKAGMPIIFYDRIPHGLEVSQVIINDYLKSFFLVERLIRAGRRNIVHVQGPDNIYNSIERLRGYRDALAKYNIPFDKETMLFQCSTQLEDSSKIADLFVENIKHNKNINAVFAFSEMQGLGIMNRLMEHGIKIPEEIAIASLTGTILSNYVYPKMTAVEAPMYQMGATAAELLLAKIKDPQTPNKTVVLDAEIKMRQSTPPIIQ